MGHIETAVSMFNAGSVVHEYFRHHTIGTEEEKARRRSTIIPTVVLYIFGLEVGMKALIEKQGESPPKTHDLERLYGQLDVSVQSKITTKMLGSGANVSSLESLLGYHRNSLEEWRYMGDLKNSLIVDLDALAASLKAAIEVHSEEYGSESKARPSEGGQSCGVPTSIQKAASRYIKDVFTTDPT